MTTPIYRVEPKQGTAAAWTSDNPVLLSGETGYETDTKKTKRGDGTTAWSALPYDPTNADISTALSEAEAYTDAAIIAATGGTGVASIIPGTNVSVDNTDPRNPVVSATLPSGTVSSVDGVSPGVGGDVALGLATVATTGAYADLSGKPTLGTAAAHAVADFDAAGAAATAQTTAEAYTDTAVAGRVTTTTTVNGHALSANVTVSAADVGLGNVNNTSDASKPVSTATQTALNAKADLVGGVVPTSQIPALALTATVVVASQAAMLALTTGQVQPGDIAVRTDGAGTFVLTAADPSVLANWQLLNAPTDHVLSVNGQTGTVVLAAADVGAATTAQGTKADTAVQPGSLATVATTGAYSDLTGKPTLGTAAAKDVPAAGNASATQVVFGTDTRLSDARTPTAHASTHASGGSDPITVAESQVTNLTTDLNAKVPTTRTVAGHALSADVTITPADIGAVPTTRQVNGHALSADVTITAADVSAVPTTRTVAGHALSADVTLSDADISPVTTNDQTGTTYTFVLADGSRLVRVSNAAAITVTIPLNSAVAFPIGTTLSWAQQGAGQITVAITATGTLRIPHGAKTSAQYVIATATKVATDEWYVSGDVTP